MKDARIRANVEVRRLERTAAEALRQGSLDGPRGGPVEEITVGGLLDLIRNRWFLIAAITLLTTLGVGFVTFRVITPVYQSTAMVLIKPGREFVDDTQPRGRDAISNRMDGIVMAEIEILHSEDLIRDAVTALGPRRLYPDLGADLGADPVQAAIARFREDFSATAAPGTAVIRISFRHPEPGTAADSVNVLVDLFKEHHLRAFSQPQSTSFLEGKVDEYSRDLQKAEQNLREFQEQHPVLTFNGAVQELEQQRAQLDVALKQARNDVAALKQQIAFLKEHQAKLSRTSAQHEALDLQIVNADSGLRAQMARQEGLERQVANVSVDLRTLPGYLEKNRELLRERDAAEARYRLHSERLEQALVSGEMDRAKIANISVIQRGQVPPEPSYPRKSLNLAIGAALGLGLGLGIAYFREGFAMRNATDLIEETRMDFGPRVGGEGARDARQLQHDSTEAEPLRAGPALEAAQPIAVDPPGEAVDEERHHQPDSWDSGPHRAERSHQPDASSRWFDPTPPPSQGLDPGGDEHSLALPANMPLLRRLCKTLSEQGVGWCHQDIEDAIDQRLARPDDHHLFVRRTDAQRFIAILHQLGFKQVSSDSVNRPGVVEYCAYDHQNDCLVWVSASYHVDLGERGRKRRRPRVEGARAHGRVGLVSGGALIALVGADGAGKSTAVDALHDWLSPHFRVVRFHMGKPRQSLSTIAVKVLLKVGGRASNGLSSPLDVEPSEQRDGFRWLVYQVVTARDRLRAYRRARRLASRGVMVLCDRFPLPEIRSMDGRRASRQAAPPRSWLARMPTRLEERYYGAIARPDLLLVLKVQPDAALRRRPEDPEGRVRERAREVLEVDWVEGDAHVVDAEQSISEVHRELKSWIWSRL